MLRAIQLNKRAIIALIAFSLLSYTLTKIDLSALVMLNSLPLSLIAALLTLQLATIVLISHQWLLILRHNQIPATLADMLTLNMLGTFAESITPAAKSGGEAVKVLLLRNRQGLSYPKAVAITLVQKFFSIIVFILLLMWSLANLEFSLPWQLSQLIGPLVAVVLSLLVIRYKLLSIYQQVLHFLRKTLAEISQLRLGQLVPYLLANNLIIWLLYPTKVFLIVAHLQLDVSFWTICMITFATYGVSLLPTTPGSVGTFEGTMVLLLRFSGISLENALTVAILSRFFTFWLVVVISGLFTLIHRKKLVTLADQ